MELEEAIKIVQGLKVYYDDECLLDEEELEENKTVNNAIDTLINLIENQQKERDDIYNDYQDLGKENLKLQEELEKYKTYYEEMEEVNKKFIAVDKIKEKIKECKKELEINKDNSMYMKLMYTQKEVLNEKIKEMQELLEENKE